MHRGRSPRQMRGMLSGKIRDAAFFQTHVQKRFRKLAVICSLIMKGELNYEKETTFSSINGRNYACFNRMRRIV